MRRRAHLRLVTSFEAEDTTLAAVLTAEDLAVDLGLDPKARITCGRHRCWSHHCVGWPDHVRFRAGTSDPQVEMACRTSFAASRAQ
ncbi:hypothetical protein [Lentzea guizhouensis]|nr:hypothetical protein [Lentzea guizhouensis]